MMNHDNLPLLHILAVYDYLCGIAGYISKAHIAAPGIGQQFENVL